MKEFYQADGHCDSATVLGLDELLLGSSQRQLDLKRFLQYGNLQFFAFFIAPQGNAKSEWQQLNKHLTKFLQALEQTPQIQLLKTAQQLKNSHSHLALLALEGVYALDWAPKLADKQLLLDQLYQKGIRSIGLFWNPNSWFGCGANANLIPQQDSGLTPAGKELLSYLSEKKLLLDFAHSSWQSLADGLAIAPKPIFVSHTACWQLCQHKRNLTDLQLRQIAQQEGIIGITFVPEFLTSCPQEANLNHVVQHIIHAVHIAGIEHVALGSDFDGTEQLPQGLQGIEDMPQLSEALKKAGFHPREMEYIMGKNWLHFLQAQLE